MARYINADKLIAHLEDEICECKPPQGGRAGGKSIAYGTMLGLKSAIAFADALATADVAPRSEVAREIFEEIEAQINALEYNARTPRKTVSVDELKAQMDWVLREVIPGTLAKIKQKYTEE